MDENMKRWFTSRGIPVEVAEAEGITKACRKMPQTERLENCIIFPYHVEGELVNRKYRDGAKNFMLEKDANELLQGGKEALYRAIAIERDRTQGVTRVHVQKVKFRHLGYPGVASFQYNTHNGRFVNFVAPATPDLPNPDVVWDNSSWLVKKEAQQTAVFQ